MTQTTNNGRTQRKNLATEIDRLDNILDGLDEALAGAVEMAVRDMTGRVVREAVEVTLKEVLSNPDLMRAAVAQHAPVATFVQPIQPTPRRTLKEWLKEKLNWLNRMAAEKASQAKRGLGSAWSWCVEKVKKGCGPWLWGRCKRTISGCKNALSFATPVIYAAWKFRQTTAIAMGVGALVGIAAYFAGPIIAGSLCGLGGAAMTVAGMVLWPLWRLMSGNDA